LAARAEERDRRAHRGPEPAAANLRQTGSRTDQQIKTMSADDMRNTVIVEVSAKMGIHDYSLQALSNISLIHNVLVRPTKYLH
jgi:hypothetical protein